MTYVPFPTDELPPAVAAFIHQGAAALGCDESYIALPLLAVLASAVGNTEAEAALADLVKAGDGKWETDDHDGGRGRPAKVFQLLSGGNGNGNGENPEENRFPLPVEAHGYSADAEKEGKSIGGSHGGEAISE